MNIEIPIKIDWIDTVSSGCRAFVSGYHVASVVREVLLEGVAVPWTIRNMLPGLGTWDDKTFADEFSAKAYAERVVCMWFAKCLRLREQHDPLKCFLEWLKHTGREDTQASYDAWLDTLPKTATINIPLIRQSLKA